MGQDNEEKGVRVTVSGSSRNLALFFMAAASGGYYMVDYLPNGQGDSALNGKIHSDLEERITVIEAELIEQRNIRYKLPDAIWFADHLRNDNPGLVVVTPKNNQ